jgi:hypothetical protein
MAYFSREKKIKMAYFFERKKKSKWPIKMITCNDLLQSFLTLQRASSSIPLHPTSVNTSRLGSFMMAGKESCVICKIPDMLVTVGTHRLQAKLNLWPENVEARRQGGVGHY